MEWSDPMTEFFDAHRPATAFDHDSTLVVAMELSGKSWQLGAVIPGVSRRPKTGVKARDMNEVMRVVDRWKAEAVRAAKTVARIVVAYEAGRDGFWIARELTEREIEAHVMQPASIPVERKGQRREIQTSPERKRAEAGLRRARKDQDVERRRRVDWWRASRVLTSPIRIDAHKELSHADDNAVFAVGNARRASTGRRRGSQKGAADGHPFGPSIMPCDGRR